MLRSRMEIPLSTEKETPYCLNCGHPPHEGKCGEPIYDNHGYNRDRICDCDKSVTK